MSWRFKASKYKNAAPKVPKPDEWVRELNIGSYQVNGQVVKASAAFAAFNSDVAGKEYFQLPLSKLISIIFSYLFREQLVCHST